MEEELIYKHGMKVVENDTIPFGNYKCMTVYKWIFTKNAKRITQVDYNHEATHLQQQVELLVVLFYLWYCLEFLVKLLCTFNWKRAYRSISFEQEAYLHEQETKWLLERPEYYWLRFVLKLVRKN